MHSIIIHQAFYGEVNRAHSCIKQTITDPDLTSFLITFTDRPAALPPGVNLMPYLSGSAFSKYYIFTKTFPDQTATRAGMVFTHVLILNQSDINSIHNLQDVFSHFVASTENKNDELKETLIECSKSSPVSGGINQPKYIQQTISDFIKTVSPILFSGEIETFRKALQQIWNSPNKGARKKIKFRTSFTPSDIENVSDLTIVLIQKDFLSKWQGQSIIYGEHQEAVEITSHSEALFLGYKEANPFHNFLVELNVNLSEVQSYSQYEKVYADYISIEKIEDANILRQAIRALAKFSPSPKEGKVIKKKFLTRLSSLINSGRDYNIKALRNVQWSAIEKGEEKIRNIISLFIYSKMEEDDSFKTEILSELIILAVTEQPKNWWHHCIIDEMAKWFESGYSPVDCKKIWALILFSEQCMYCTISIFEDCYLFDDNILINYLIEPHNPIDKRTINYIEIMAKDRGWTLMYAVLLIEYLPLEEAIIEIIEVEKSSPLKDSIGLNYLKSKIAPDKLIDLTLKTCDLKLIEYSSEAIVKDLNLLKDINLNSSCWFDIWTSVVLKTNEVFSGIQGKERVFVFYLLDLIGKGKNVNGTVVDLIAETKFSDISEYKDRSKIWSLFSLNQREKFLNSTAPTVLNDLLLEKFQIDSIEFEISNRITSHAFMTKFLSENRSNIEPVITVFSSFKILKDEFLATYITNFTSTITEAQAKKLGDLIRKFKFNKSARSIFNKVRNNNSFYPAYENCKELVTLSWWEFPILVKPSQEPFKPKKQLNPILKNEQLMRTQLPTVVILTAIKEEYLAVRQHLIEIFETKQNDTHYEAGIFEFKGKEIAKIIIRECGAKNTTSAIETERAINYFRPDAMFFVGIAGSRKPNDFSIGDVIFPEAILSYEGGKSEKDSFLARPDIGVLTYAVLETAKSERKKEDWKMLLKNSIDPKTVKADIGIIASGEQVVEHYESEVGKIITEHYNHISAVEMEGFGFAKTINRQGRETSNIFTGIVRGISDIIEQPNKTKINNETDRRPANTKQLASDTAAAFTFWLILKTYE